MRPLQILVAVFFFAGAQSNVAALSAPTAIVSYHADHLGSAVLLTDGTGAAIERNAFTPYGEGASGGHRTAYLFTGQEYDAESNLYYFRGRYYSQQVGR